MLSVLQKSKLITIRLSFDVPLKLYPFAFFQSNLLGSFKHNRILLRLARLFFGLLIASQVGHFKGSRILRYG